jgi:predicted acyltransferase
VFRSDLFQRIESITCGIRAAHFASLFLRELDIHELALADAWTPSRGPVPLLGGLHQFRPEWKRAALGRFDRVDATAGVLEEDTTGVTRRAQSSPLFGAVNVLTFELVHRHLQICSQPGHVGIGEIHEALLVAAASTTRLALESHFGDGRHSSGIIEHTQDLMAQASIASTPAAIPEPAQRLVSLDAFRGATMALMVLVNTPGDGDHTYAPLQHSQWNGWTITDVVFPSFLWIVGLAITLSLSNRLAAGIPRSRLLSQIFRRAAILYVLGLLIYAFPHFDLSTQRLMGVLQRIAICYLIASCIFLYTGVRGQILWIAGLLAGYWMMMTLIPVPGFGAGRLDVDGNFAHYIDRIVIGRHNYRSTKTWDPEGIISTLPSIATALFGIMAGHILRLKRDLAERTTWMFLIGNLLLAAGLICNIWLPINKKLWTSSFSLFMAGLDFVILAICIWLIDRQGYRRLTRPFVILGMNAITIYMISELLEELLTNIPVGDGSLRDWIYEHLFAPLASPVNASLLYAVAYTLLMFAIAYGMYRRKWFIKV